LTYVYDNFSVLLCIDIGYIAIYMQEASLLLLLWPFIYGN